MGQVVETRLFALTIKMWPDILGIPLEVSIMWSTTVLYLACAVALYFSVIKNEPKNELSNTLLVFLISLGLSMFFMGAEMYWMNMFFGYLGTLAILIGSVFMIKFPLTVFSKTTGKYAFYLIFILSMLFFVWMVVSPTGNKIMMPLTSWYDIGINGLVTGFFVFFIGLQAKERWLRIKATGGGLGIMACCVAAEVATMSGAILLSAVFQFISPIILLVSVLVGRKYQAKSQNYNMSHETL